MVTIKSGDATSGQQQTVLIAGGDITPARPTAVIAGGDATPLRSPPPKAYCLRLNSEISEEPHTFRRACEHACMISKVWGGSVAVVRKIVRQTTTEWKTIVAYDHGQRSYYDWREVALAREAERASGEYSAAPVEGA